MWLEDTWCAWHGEHIGIGCKRIPLKRILLLLFRTVLHVVILDESNCITTIIGIVHKIFVAAQLCPVWSCNNLIISYADSVTNIITELEVEGCALLVGSVYPTFYLFVSIPIFANRVFYTYGIIIVGNVATIET